MERARNRIVYAGTYEREYPRNALIVEALRQAGFEVCEFHHAVWERVADKSRRVGPFEVLRLGAALVAAYVVLIARLALSLRRADLVMIGYIGQIDMLVLGPLAKLARRPVAFNPLVTLTDTVVEDRQLVRRDSLLAHLIGWIDRAALALSDVILVDTQENGDYLAAHFGVPRDQIAVVPVGADEQLFQKVGAYALDASPAGARPDGRVLQVLFYGKMIPLHGAETIVRAAALLEADGGFLFTVIGSGQTLDRIRGLVDQLRLTTVRMVPWVPYERLATEIEQADVVLGIFGDGAKAGRVVPNKVYQAMAMGKAIVTRDSPAIRHVLRDGVSAALVPAADPDALAQALRRLRDADVRAQLGAAARTAFTETASLTVQAATLRRVIDALPLGRAGRLVTRGTE